MQWGYLILYNLVALLNVRQFYYFEIRGEATKDTPRPNGWVTDLSVLEPTTAFRENSRRSVAMKIESPFLQRTHRKFPAVVIRLLCALFVLGSLTARVSFAQDGGGTHTVKVGENLSSIAAMYNVSVSALLSANRISNPNILNVGQVLVIPAAALPTPEEPPIPTSTPTPERILTPTAAPEETAAPEFAPVRPTDETVVPTPSVQYVPQIQVAPLTTDTIHIVRSRENLSAIALQYGTSVDAIVRRNFLSSYVINAGQRLIIPMGAAPINPFITPTAKAARPTPAPTRPAPPPTRTPTPKAPGLFLLPVATAIPMLLPQ